MNKPEKKWQRHLLGYCFGSLVFLILIPGGLWGVSIIFPFEIIVDKAAVPTVLLYPIAIMVSAGLFFAIWSNIDLLRVGKGGPADVFGVEVSPRSRKLVVTGPYRFTRNPMVFGMNILYFSLALALNSWSAVIAEILFVSIVVIYLKMTEEKRLENDFGQDYRDYKARVSMIFPWFPRR